ncbi:transposase [Sulfurimonas sp. HSL3-7]|uniref:transposase n=1 Tax=Sulfonitrofixus jiaomeiensis TaxID=3131938 RepID=UPI0031F91B7D
MQWYKECIYCHHHVYHLNDGMLKCSRCKAKYSPERVNKVVTLIDSFCENENALQASKRLRLSYVSVHRYYEEFRKHSARICEDEYETLRHKPCEYEEYFYLERSKRQRSEAIFDAHNFITFDYEGHLYTIVMPTLKKYRQQFIDDNLEDVYASEFIRFKRKSRLIKVSKHLNKIVRFWDYLEKAILTYKGVSAENFPLYLKEIEFKFNHDAAARKALLQQYYFRSR